jgi:hypothetical protein
MAAGRPGRFGLGLLVIVLALAACTTSSPSSSSSTASPGTSTDGTTQTIGGVTLPTSTGSPTPDEAKQIAKAAYIFGFPLVVMNGTKAQLTNVPSAQPTSAPVNQFNTPSVPFTPSFTAVPAPPVDVLFSSAWLDLSKEAYSGPRKTISRTRRVAIGDGPLSGRIGFAHSTYRKRTVERVLYHRVLSL